MLSEITDFIKKHKDKGKRTCFDFDYLNEWIEWALIKDYLFTSKDRQNNITAVLVVCPIGKWLKTPNIEQIIDSVYKKHTENTDYYIMDALALNEESRQEVIDKALTRFKNIENDPKTELFAYVNDRVVKFNKKTLLTLLTTKN